MALCLIIIVYFFSRLINLTSLPIFNDEAIYLHWALIMRDTSERFFSLAFDGKQPLGMWFFGFAMWLIKDPLIAGRMVPICFGLMTLLGIYYLAKNLGNRQVAIIASFLYIVSPYTLFFDRMALMESMVSTISIWSLFFVFKITGAKDLRPAILLGVILGLGFWIKSNTVVFVFLAFIWGLITFLINRKPWFVSAFLLSVFVACFVIFPLAAQASFPLIFKKNQEFIFSLEELFKLPIPVWWSNLLKLIQVLTGYVSPLFVPILLLAVVLLVKEKRKELNTLLFWSIGSIFLLIVSSKSLDSRYSLFLAPVLFIILSLVLVRHRWLSVCVFLPTILLGVLLLISPVKFFNFFPSMGNFAADKNQYITGWPAGFGVKEASEFLNKESGQEKILVGVRMDSGNPEDAIWLYFWQHPRMKVTYFLPASEFWQRLKTVSAMNSVYFVSRDNQLLGHEKEMMELVRFVKPEGKSYIGIYKIL